MQDTSILWLRMAALLYVPGVLQALLSLLRRDSKWFGLAVATFATGTTLALVSMVERGIAGNRLPLNNFYESMADRKSVV